MSGGFGKADWKVCGGSLEGVGMFPDEFREANWRVWEGCLEGVGMLPDECAEAHWSVRRLSIQCGMIV